MILLKFSTEANLFFTFITVLFTIGLGYILYVWFKVERKKFREDNDTLIDGMVSKSALASDVEFLISRSGANVTFSLIYVNIDAFGNVNESFGRHTGDQVLKHLGKEFLRIMPRRTILTKLKGDRFVLFIRTEYSRAELYRVCDKILETVSQPINISRNIVINVTASLGIARYPEHGGSYKKLLENLELAAYISKREGGNRATEYSVEFGSNESENLELYNQVKEAINNKEFVLYYQPIVSVRYQKLIGMEALLRWEHPVHGVLSPFKFISIMEQSGDINWVGLWGLESLIKQQLEWRKTFPNLPLFVSMNLSPKQLISATVVDDFRNILKKYKAVPQTIGLEVTDFSMFDKISDVRTNILKLRDLGFKICIEGLGLDYNALSRLESLPIDVIKLERSFGDMEEKSFVKEKFVEMLVDLTLKLDRTIISEGIENREGLEYVFSHRVENVQGFLFSKPISSTDMTKYIIEEHWRKAFAEPKENDEGDVSKDVQNTIIEEESHAVVEELAEADSNEQTAVKTDNEEKNT